MTSQLLYIALGFGAGLTVAAAMGTLALLRWTGKPEANTRDENNFTEADKEASNGPLTSETTSEAESEQTAHFHIVAREYEDLARRYHTLAELRRASWQETMRQLDAIAIFKFDESEITEGLAQADVVEIDSTEPSSGYDPEKIEGSLRDAKRDLEASKW